MSIYSNVTGEDFINLRKLVEQQKNQRALEIKNRKLKQTHDIKLAESLSPVTQKLHDVIKETFQPSENIKPILQFSQSQTPKLVSASDELVETFSKMKDSKNIFEVIRDAEGKFSWAGEEVIPLGGNRFEINGEEYKLTLKIQRAFTDTR